MTEASIPVDLYSPGQVFACLGLLEAAELLCGDVEGGFDWNDESEVKFSLRANGDRNPVATVLEFLAGTEVRAVAPERWRPRKEPVTERDKRKLEEELDRQENSKVFPSLSPDKSSGMPIQITDGKKKVVLGHWADGSSRNEFKLYAGNRSALGIATTMIKGIVHLWGEQQDDLIERPFSITMPMRGSFNFDPRGAWTTIDAGYSPNDQKHQVEASPVVELLAAWGMESARPEEFKIRKVRYAVWGIALQPILARVALIGGIPAIPMKLFRFKLDMSGKNKVVTFAEQEITYD